MRQAKYGDTVRVHYTGKLGDGTMFDSSLKREALQITIGQGQVISGFEQAVLGMTPGQSKTVVVHADKAYGPYLKERVLVVDRKEFPAEFKPTIGEQIQLRQPDGRGIVVTVTGFSESSLTLDANHPLAGKDLTFDIELLEIIK